MVERWVRPAWSAHSYGTDEARPGSPVATWADIYPNAEIILVGVEEPMTLMHAPNESVHPDEIANMALTEALFLRRYATTR